MKKNKVGICTLYTGYNFGSALQAYASKIVIKKLNYQPEIIKVSGSFVKGRDIRLKKMIVLFIRMMMYSKNRLNVIKSFKDNNKSNINKKTIDEFNKFYANKLEPTVISYQKLKKLAKTEEYVSFVCGSDQIWNSSAFYVDPFYYLDFCPRNKRIAYAPSFGRTFVPSYNKKIIKKYLQGITNIVVREDSGQKIVEELINRSVDVCLDPTLLLNNKEWNEHLKLSDINDDYIFCYFLNQPSIKAKNFINQISKEKKLKIISINNDFFENSIYGGPEIFLSYLKDANYVITDSFHGVAFSINFRKNFYVFDRQYITEDQSTRIKSLLNIVGLSNCFESSIVLDDNYFDYEKIYYILEKERKKSINFLIDSIRSCDCDDK